MRPRVSGRYPVEQRREDLADLNTVIAAADGLIGPGKPPKGAPKQIRKLAKQRGKSVRMRDRLQASLEPQQPKPRKFRRLG